MFIFDVSSVISFKDYQTFLQNLKSRFDSRKTELLKSVNFYENAEWKNNLSCYIKFRDSYRQLRQSVVKEVLAKFRPFLPKQCLIYEFGSLTKQSDRIESDIDLTICYDVPKTKLYENVEELIDYSIVYIFENSIDHIHGKFQHYPMIHDYDDLNEQDHLYVLDFGDGKIEYRCGPHTLSENLMNIKNVRDYGSLIAGYEEKYQLKCNMDCLYSVIILENTTEHDFIHDLSKLEQSSDIFSQYNKRCHEYSFGEIIAVSDMKRALKNTIVDLYEMLAFLRRKIQWNSQYSMTLPEAFCNTKLLNYFGRNYMTRLENFCNRMIFWWDKLELMLKKKTIFLSTRSPVILTRQDLEEMLRIEYHKENLTTEIFSSINELNQLLLSGWNRIQEK